MANKPYMPLMMGDWIRGTRGMKAEVKGVYVGLLIHQYDNGFIPADLDELRLIEPEIDKVWDKLKDKFKHIDNQRLVNEKLEEVRAFFNKQKQNGSLGGRPKNPNNNPNNNPNINLHNEYEYEYDISLNGVGQNFSKNGNDEKQRIDLFRQDLLADRYTIEKTCINTRIDESKLLQGLEIFITTKISSKESLEWKTDKDFRRNFIFWIPSWIEREKKEMKKNGVAQKTKQAIDD